MNKKCPNCQLINFSNAERCKRCDFTLNETGIVSENNKPPLKSQILKRAVICLAVCLICIAGFYFSLVFSAKSLSYDEKETVNKAIDLLEEKGFSDEVFMLRHLTVYRANDNWLNASTRLEEAYAATNFPFEIMTIYPEYFIYPVDDTERAAILLHEAKHLKGADEKEAYEFVWRNRKKLGWTKEIYGKSIVWRNVRKQTKEYAPNLFICEINEYSDCTEN
jgi:hypothetical protein